MSAYRAGWPGISAGSITTNSPFETSNPRASSFHGTYLAGFLRAAGVDTVLVTGVTASACVRETVCDALADGFRPIAVKEAIGAHPAISFDGGPPLVPQA